jgi:hypothetical protein
MQIDDLTLSFAWAEATPALLLEPQPAGAPLHSLGRNWTYEAQFDRAIREGQAEQGLQVPWPAPEGQRFWTFYLDGQAPGTVRPHEAWKKLVPFRWRLPDQPSLKGAPGRIWAEALFYPHGFALILTARIQPGRDLDRTVERCMQLRRDHVWSVPSGGSGGVAKRSLNGLAKELRERAREHALGAGAPAGRINPDPFSVATFIRGTAAAREEVGLQVGGPVHRALETLTSWKRQGANPPALDPETRQDANGVLYVRRSGRAVWFPGQFLSPGSGAHSLSCYHRNLVFSVAQVESLAGLIHDAKPRLERDPGPSATYRDCTRHAAGILGRMYGAQTSTYQTRSARAQIDHGGRATEINAVRDHFDMAPLKA